MLYVNLNLLAVKIEFDAIIMLGWVSGNHSSNSHHFSLIMDCRTHINQIPQVKMKHCYRESNKCVDVLARMGAGSSQDLLLFDSLHMELSMLLFYDYASIYYKRPRTLYVDV